MAEDIIIIEGSKIHSSNSHGADHDNNSQSQYYVTREEHQKSMEQMHEKLRQLVHSTIIKSSSKNNHHTDEERQRLCSSIYNDDEDIVKNATKADDAAEEEQEDEMHSLPGDIYSMLFIAPIPSQAFFYSIFLFLTKITFYCLILIEIFVKGFYFPQQVNPEVRATQLLMLPVTVLVTDEGLLGTLFIVHLQWVPDIMKLHPLATRRRFQFSKAARAMDAVSYGLVIICVLLQATDVLTVFLNFAALRFLLEIDTVAFQVALNGYLTEPLCEISKQVELIKLGTTDDGVRRNATKVFFLVSFIAMLSGWMVVHFVI